MWPLWAIAKQVLTQPSRCDRLLQCAGVHVHTQTHAYTHAHPPPHCPGQLQKRSWPVHLCLSKHKQPLLPMGAPLLLCWLRGSLLRAWFPCLQLFAASLKGGRNTGHQVHLPALCTRSLTWCPPVSCSPPSDFEDLTACCCLHSFQSRLPIWGRFLMSWTCWNVAHCSAAPTARNAN